MGKPIPIRRAQKDKGVKSNGDETPLAERWLRALKDNPFIAAIIVIGVCVSGVVAFYKGLPDQVQAALIQLLPQKEAKASNGWAWAGYLDKQNIQVWATGPFVTLVKKSGAADRLYPLRTGDVVTPNMDLPQVIIDYKTRKNDNVLIAPSDRRTAIQPEDDYTGAKFKSGENYIVASLAVNAFRDHDFVVWLRLIPAN